MIKKLKNLTTMQWISLAVSTDSTRPNLKLVYSDKGQLVATDGHRLHLGPIPKTIGYTGYPADSAFTDEYPDYRNVLSENQLLGKLSIESSDIKQLTALAKLDNNLTTPVNFKIDADSQVLVSFKTSSLSYSFHFPRKINDCTMLNFEVNLNLHYLVDALRIVEISGSYVKDVSIKISKDYDPAKPCLTPITIESEGHLALIMPLRCM